MAMRGVLKWVVPGLALGWAPVAPIAGHWVFEWWHAVYLAVGLAVPKADVFAGGLAFVVAAGPVVGGLLWTIELWHRKDGA